MHGPRHKSLIQLVFGYGIIWEASGWPLLDRINELSRFTCLLLQVFDFFARVCYASLLHQPAICF